MSFVNTPYDDVFRTLLNDCSSLIIPVINEVFGKHYTGKEKVVFQPNEHFLNQQDGNEEKRISDTNFHIVAQQTDKYHLECSCTPDSTLLVRFFEYDTQIALDEGTLEGNVLRVSFPHSAVLFLRHTKTTPEYMHTIIETPGGSVSYRIPVIKAQAYSLDEIFDKNLLFLIPFYIFSHEKNFEQYNSDNSRLSVLQKDFARIRDRLEYLSETGAVSTYTKCTVTDMTAKVVENLARNYENVRKGVKDVMGGKILDYEAKRILNAGITEGEARGKAQGEARGIIESGFDFGLSEPDILNRLQQKMNIPLQAAQDYLSLFAKKML